MAEHLVFTLTAALGSMGDFAGHERRGSLTWPGRSAILGLLGAAMGIRRDADFSALDGLRMAVAVFDHGEVLRDFHTAQTVPSAAAKHPQARPAALAEAGLRVNTAITLRDYRSGPLYGVALWNGPLPAIAEALERPAFHLYLGRKSCPLAAPVAPQIVKADGPIAALDQLRMPPWRSGAVARQVLADDGVFEGTHREVRNDVPLDRTHWHFGPRVVEVAQAEIAPKVAGEGVS